MRVKVCGICRPEDAALAAAAGADYVGVILAPGFRRSRSAAEARAIYAAAGTCLRAGVFVDGSLAEMAALRDDLALDVVQLSGSETPAAGTALRAGRARVWKALRPVSPAALLAEAAAWVGAADALLLDASGAGGSGARFDWEAVAAVRSELPRELELVVAGGLNPANVARAIGLLRPAVVDVSSGVEAALGEKSPAAVRAFVTAARVAALGADPVNVQES
jgi:phosphoribosylanthranilate isomerase